MKVHQLSVTYLREQDRLLVRINTSDAEELRLWFTRRLMLELWPMMHKVLTDQLVSLESSVTSGLAADEDMKQMLADWERKTPGRIENTFRALTDVRPSQLADRTLFDFAALGARGDRSDAHGWLAGEAVDAEPTAARERVRTALSGLDILEA